eukprot:2670606-Karenia_brevis.AAC.1
MPHKRSYFCQSGQWTRRQISRWQRDAWYRQPAQSRSEELWMRHDSFQSDASAESPSRSEVQQTSVEHADKDPAQSGNAKTSWADVDGDDIPECWDDCFHEGEDAMCLGDDEDEELDGASASEKRELSKDEGDSFLVQALKDENRHLQLDNSGLLHSIWDLQTRLNTATELSANAKRLQEENVKLTEEKDICLQKLSKYAGGQLQ